MLQTLLLPILLQSVAPPAEYYEPEFSQEVEATLENSADMQPEVLIATLERFADNGDDSALEVLGELYSFGLFGFERDPVRACDYFERVGDRRPDSLHNQGTCYFAGDGRAQDYARARELYAAAAEDGWIMSHCAYGNMLVRGEGGPKDAEQGVQLCRMTAIAGDADAQTDYGGYLLMGIGGERDPVAARFMLEQAGSQEQANAAFLLGQIHTKGDGTAVDHAAAGGWFAKAYEWGRRDAAYQHALSLARRGFRREGEEMFVARGLMTEAIAWFEIAAETDPDPEVRAQATEMIVNSKGLLAATPVVGD